MGPGAPVVAWPDPAPIVYGTPLGELQLSASASTGGTWTYSPAAGTVLGAGEEQILTAIFTPSDSGNYSPVPATRRITVARATASVELTTGSFTYDGQPHGATAAARAADGTVLGPVTITYNGGPAEPCA